MVETSRSSRLGDLWFECRTRRQIYERNQKYDPNGWRPVPRIQYHWEHSLTPLGWSCMALTTLSIPGSASRVPRDLTEINFISMVITFRILTLEERYHYANLLISTLGSGFSFTVVKSLFFWVPPSSSWLVLKPGPPSSSRHLDLFLLVVPQHHQEEATLELRPLFLSWRRGYPNSFSSLFFAPFFFFRAFSRMGYREMGSQPPKPRESSQQKKTLFSYFFCFNFSVH
ncbi:hypothetical protein VNO77_44238 [Canavalia gladiata]|uniref:Uncharacterized protein n=1 Tax=Canavalia gladiata TaxID=3824 RepID=A0AAN9JVN8_CANGL